MKISIITVVYNAEKFISDCIKSVLDQDYNLIEYIVIDGGSTDHTLKIISNYQIAKVISEKDEGIYDALNKGISLASGEVIGFLHADDFYASPKIISKVMGYFAKHEADIVYGDLDYVDRFNKEKILRKWRSKPYADVLIENGWMPAHPTVFIKKSLYNQFGNFDITFTSAADYDLLLRFFYKTKFKKIYVPLVFVKMRTGGKSNLNLKNRIFANREDYRALVKNRIPYAKIVSIIKPIRKVLQFFK